MACAKTSAACARTSAACARTSVACARTAATCARTAATCARTVATCARPSVACARTKNAYASPASPIRSPRRRRCPREDIEESARPELGSEMSWTGKAPPVWCAGCRRACITTRCTHPPKCCRATRRVVRSGRRVGGHIAERELLRSNVASNAARRCAPLVKATIKQRKSIRAPKFSPLETPRH